MKNREKYKNELMEAIKKDCSLCKFVEHYGVFRMFQTDCESFCGPMDCHACATALQLWLDEEYEEPEDEEYEEPEVDWDNVPVDTLVRVRDDEEDTWALRYFNRFDENTLDGRNYVVFGDGATSVTAEGYVESWEFCELAEVTNGK